MQKLSIGLVGYGSWGKKLFKALQKTRSINTVALCDTSHQAIDELGPLRSGIKFITNKYQEFLSSKDIDAVVVATPADTHYQIAMDSLKAGKHVLLEKPMTLDKTQARMLYKLADKKKLILMVDHTYLYAPEIRVAKQMIDSGSLGNIRLIEITRVGPGQYKNDCDVIWDFAPHDLSILYYLRGIPIELSAMNSSHLSRYHIDVSNIYFKFVDGCEARVHLSWLSPIKIRKILAVGSKKTLLLEQYNTNTKIHIYPNAYY
ncbi:MAG TPA: Gfo/Idh/MocA family oxidoreductase, partial [Candidatus Babeliales bacterium]|nr:Gfo/Idh/MocA family oxidoreductase [Candidatus Babeliales bacterium]